MCACSYQNVCLLDNLARYLEKQDWRGAYQMACLGVTDADWRALALAALEVGSPPATALGTAAHAPQCGARGRQKAFAAPH